METDFLSLKDESHFSNFSSPIYEHGMLEDSDASLLDIIKDEFPYGPPDNAPSFWDTEPELNEAFNYPSLDAARPDMANSKEDFQKMLTDWQEHLGSLQASDTDDLEMTMSLRQSVPEHLPDAIFEGESVSTSVTTIAEPSSGRSLLKPKQERLGNKSCVYGMKIGGRDARLPIMEDSNSGEDANNILLTLKPSCNGLINNEPMQQMDEDEDCIDIETVTEQIPVLEAGDLKSLLEQFEASEAVNTVASRQKSSLLPSLIVPHQSVSITTSQTALAMLSHQKIRDSLPQEIIDKIRASSRKKLIPLIPAMPSKRIGRGTRMQDAAATLNRNKLLKLVSGSAGDTVQLDHDYCSVMEPSPPVNFYNCDANEYSNRSNYVKPEGANSPLSSNSSRIVECKAEQQQSEVSEENLAQQVTRLTPAKTECWEKNAKKDSGLESGEVSDASEEVVPSLKLEPDQCEYTQTQPTKKKLNLQEYRSRREELEKLRGRQNLNCNVTHLSPPPIDETSSSGPSPAASPNALSKPTMHSVQVQTQDAALTEETEKRLGRSRDHANRRYRSRRSSGHGWSSSGSSCSPHWQRRATDQSSWNRRRPRIARNSRKIRTRRNTNSDASSRSPSTSRSTCSSSASRSRSRSRSRGGSNRHRLCVNKRSSSCSSRRGPRMRTGTADWKRRSCSPGGSICISGGEWQLTERERQRQVEERRVIYVGRLPEGTTKNDLRKRFEVFGPIVDISVHFREHGDNYGFVTFLYKVDAYEAVEHGNEDPSLPIYDLCFGGRRTFCKVRYSDLDAQAGGIGYRVKSVRAGLIVNKQESFDRLLREAQDKLQKRGKL